MAFLRGGGRSSLWIHYCPFLWLWFVECVCVCVRVRVRVRVRVCVCVCQSRADLPTDHLIRDHPTPSRCLYLSVGHSVAQSHVVERI